VVFRFSPLAVCGVMAMSAKLDISEGFQKEAEREIRVFTRDWTARDDRIALLSYVATFVVYFSGMATALWSWPNLWMALPAIILTAFASVRIYVLQHDCGHASLFSTTKRNTWAGYALSVFSLTPFSVMRFNHNEHHTHIGNLDERHTTEILTMTLKEWESAPLKQRLFYRLYRNPFIMIPVGGFFTYVLAYRWPKNVTKIGVAEVVLHNICIAVWVGLIWSGFGLTGVAIYLSTVFLAGGLGVFLVYLQHNFEDTYWDRKPDLNYAQAALQGASALDLGWWFDLAVANITYHDIHHFNANIPSYRLRNCHLALREKYDVPTIGWREAFRSFTLKLWDEDAGRLVPYPKVRAPQAATALRTMSQ